MVVSSQFQPLPNLQLLKSTSGPVLNLTPEYVSSIKIYNFQFSLAVLYKHPETCHNH